MYVRNLEPNQQLHSILSVVYSSLNGAVNSKYRIPIGHNKNVLILIRINLDVDL